MNKGVHVIPIQIITLKCTDHKTQYTEIVHLVLNTCCTHFNQLYNTHTPQATRTCV